jgi:two-component system NarL family response regulator
MAHGSPLRILIADDHPVVLEGLSAIIDRQPGMSVVAQAGDGRQTVALYRQHHPDVSLIDLRMPSLTGAAAIEAICREFPGARLIVLTTYDGDHDIYQALRAGARGYLLKDMFRDELLAAIQNVAAGGRHIPSRVATRLAEHVQCNALSEREQEVLELVAQGSSNRDIAEALAISEGTVKSHVNHILGKLGVADRTQAAVHALRRGIVRPE